MFSPKTISPCLLGQTAFYQVPFLAFFLKYLAMQSLKLFRHVRDLVPLWIVILHMVDRQVELVNQTALPTLNFSQIRVQTRTLTRYIFQIAFAGHSGKVLIEYPPETDQVLHQLAPRHALMGML